MKVKWSTATRKKLRFRSIWLVRSPGNGEYSVDHNFSISAFRQPISRTGQRRLGCAGRDGNDARRAKRMLGHLFKLISHFRQNARRNQNSFALPAARPRSLINKLSEFVGFNFESNVQFHKFVDSRPGVLGFAFRPLKGPTEINSIA